MTIQTNLNDRKELARRLIPFNHNEKLHYTGTPAFAYEGQGFRILRSGDIECDDEKTEAAITAFLQEAGILPQPKPEEGTETEVTQEPTQQDETPESEALPQTEPDKMEIKVPNDGMDGAQLRNLVFMLHAQQYLLNRAAGHENIHVPDRLVEDLKEEPGTACHTEAGKREVLPADVAPAHRHGNQSQPRIAHGPAERPERMECFPHGRRGHDPCQKAEGTPASEPINLRFNS